MENIKSVIIPKSKHILNVESSDASDKSVLNMQSLFGFWILLLSYAQVYGTAILYGWYDWDWLPLYDQVQCIQLLIKIYED